MTTGSTGPTRWLYICDWLPPDYGAVGQYSALFARELAEQGGDVVLAGLSSSASSASVEALGPGSLRTIRLHAQSYDKGHFLRRLWWTARTNTRMVAALWGEMRRADRILFTGSPPLLVHWIAPLNLLLRKTLVYRITDFHPECLIAARPKPSALLDLVLKWTVFWRRRVDRFEVLGEDQRVRLQQIGIASDRITLKRDPSPVAIPPDTRPLDRPAPYSDRFLLLYSGNWGVAHEYETFLEAYRRHHQDGSKRVVLWLNAVGASANHVEELLKSKGLPYVRGKPVALDRLASLLVTPDAHLITLRDAFVGYVLPSKVYGCIESAKPVLFVGSAGSDVHLLCHERMRAPYARVDVGAVDACVAALENLARQETPHAVG
jgi:hypothetical protein